MATVTTTSEVERRKASGAHKTRGRQNPAGVQPTSVFAVTPPQTLGQQERVERAAHQKRVHCKKIHDAREQE